VPGAHQPTNAGGKDAFVAKIAAGVGDTITNCPAPSTTTTSLPLPSCRAQCGDGLSGAQCRLNDLLAGPLCGDEAVDAKLQAFITRKLSGVQALLAKAAATTGRKRHRALKGMDHRLAAIQNRTRRDVRKREVSFRCGYIIIAQEIMPLRQTIMAIR